MADYTSPTDFPYNNVLATDLPQAIAAAIQASASTVTVVAASANDEAAIAATDGLRLTGVSIRETGGSATGVVILRHGTSNSGTTLCNLNVAASGTASLTLPLGGLACASGLWIERTGTGTTEVTVFTKIITD